MNWKRPWCRNADAVGDGAGGDDVVRHDDRGRLEPHVEVDDELRDLLGGDGVEPVVGSS